MKTLWCKNQENPSDRISQTWAPLIIYISFSLTGVVQAMQNVLWGNNMNISAENVISALENESFLLEVFLLEESFSETALLQKTFLLSFPSQNCMTMDRKVWCQYEIFSPFLQSFFLYFLMLESLPVFGCKPFHSLMLGSLPVREMYAFNAELMRHGKSKKQIQSSTL